jgi:methylaspartate mutase epsilon subunit
MMDAFRLLLGSIGDDSHSIGTSLLALVFREAGFFVKSLGIMNRLEDFFTNARGFDAILISCMNGHADLYLKDFPYRLKAFRKKDTAPQLWYLGGNLSVQESAEQIVKKYRSMGFDFVSAKPISCEEIRERVYKDFYRKGIKQNRENPAASPDQWEDLRIPLAEPVDDSPMPEQVFDQTRQDVLESWPTGKEVWNTDIMKNHASPGKNMHHVLKQTQANDGMPLVQPRTGVAHTQDEIEILTYLRENGLDISSIQLDAASRKNMYAQAREGVLRTVKGKTSFLNGYPVPIHGVTGIEQILQAIDTPFQIRAGSPDHRLVYEIGLAGGASSVEGGFICYLYPYDKNTSPVQSLLYWKYVDKLVDWYYKTYGIVINREYFGPLTCSLIEPVIPICINIAQALLSAKWGSRCISVGLAEQGNRCQDIAALQVLDKMTRWYLAENGLAHVTITTVFHQYMSAFPNDTGKAEELIRESSVTASLARARRIMTKTPVESLHIPSRQDNAQGLQLTRLGLRMAKGTPVNRDKINREMQLLEREVRALMQAILGLGQGSIARGIIKAFEKGILDIPFSPSIYNRNRLVTARDRDGAIRFVNPELLPFDPDIIDFHKEKIHQRMTAERLSKVSQIIEKDLTRICQNDYLKWPLDGVYLH